MTTYQQKEKQANLHDPDNLEIRVKWINFLREIVCRRMPVNKMGSPLVSDIDLMLATDEEREEAVGRILRRKKK